MMLLSDTRGALSPKRRSNNLDQLGFSIIKIMERIKKTARTASKAKKYATMFKEAVKEDPWFGTMTIASYICFCFTITSLSGGWVNYTGNLRGVEFQGKVGLFNSANNDKWVAYGYADCIKGTKSEDQLSFCSSRQALGILMIFPLISTFIAAAVLTFMLTKTLLDSRMKKAKFLVMGLYLFNSVINLIGMIVGVSTLHAILIKDDRIKDIYYGVGFVFSIINWLLFLILAPMLYFMVSSDGIIQTMPRRSINQKRSNFEPMPAYF
jgi:hypothetical protein